MVSHEFDKLYGVTSTGKIKEWRVVAVENDNGTASVIRYHGQKDGTIQVTERVIKSGKNIGKANETTVFEQAISEAKSYYNKQIDKGMSTKIPEAKSTNVPKLPMLAQPFNKYKHKIVYPCFVQPKLNGVRCFAEKISETEMRYTSRNGKVYETLHHLDEFLLKRLVVGEILDGEIFNPDLTFQKIVSLVKRVQEDNYKLQYWVYDLADTNLSYIDRLVKLKDILSWTVLEYIVPVLTYDVHNEFEIMNYHTKFVNDGFEGIIIRNSDGKYKFKHRSADLQKYKQFIDEEFEIVGGEEGQGQAEGHAILYVKTKNNQIFKVYPKGSFEYRKQLYDDLDELIGKMITIRYQELSEDGIPIFPIGLAIRDYE